MLLLLLIGAGVQAPTTISPVPTRITDEYATRADDEYTVRMTEEYATRLTEET